MHPVGRKRRVPSKQSPMLEALPAINWSALQHAYGPATDVPDQLRKLASLDAEDRKRARWQLYGNIYHQGSVYEATSYAVPFLLEILRAPDTQEKHELLALLQAIAEGSSYLQRHRPL